jgi:hypothetical protein
MVEDTCLIALGGPGRDPQSLGLEIPRTTAPAWEHLTWGTQSTNAANILRMTNLKRRE